MAWNGNNESLTQFSPLNFFYDGYVFLNTELTEETSAYLIADMTRFILSDSNPNMTLNFIINSPGGNFTILNQMSGLISLAKIKGMVINTYVLGCAGSAASLIAIQGDNRMISKNSSHFVHFGISVNVIQKATEIDKAYKDTHEFKKRTKQIYLDNCKGLTEEILSKLQEDEYGYLYGEDCIKYGLCDTIIEDELRNKSQFEEKFQKFMTNETNRKNKKDK